MKTFFILTLSIFTLSGCATKREETHSSGLIIKELSPDKWTALTKQNLLQLAQVYELSPFLYTRVVHIQTNVTPHSHPVITLNTRYSEQPRKLLAAFLHEEFHWWSQYNMTNVNHAIEDLKKYFPKVPAQKGSTKHSTYLHLIICYLEYKSLSFYIGEKDAQKIILEMSHKDKIFPWTYSQVLKKQKTINWAIRKNKILPPILF